MAGPKISPHTTSILKIWTRLRELRKQESSIVLDGNNLDVASVIAVSRHGIKPVINSDEELARRVDLSVKALESYLSNQWIVYGVNTGFGGSADSRTNNLEDLQISLLQLTQSGIITSTDRNPLHNPEREPSHVMPPEWVRGSILIRANQNLRGHSAVRLEVLQNLMNLLRCEITPLIPLRGTISASGDLMPMSYIAGAITGSPDVFVQVGSGENIRVLRSPEALQENGLTPSGLGPKEGLGLINGTAPSASVASLVLYDAQQLVFLSQMLTAFAAEAMAGNVEWTHPFIHAIRPHPGQIEAAGNIRRCLWGSKFVTGLEIRERTGDGIWQDRYSTRTAPQWIGPYLEDLQLAQRQIEIELNSTSDNPLVDPFESDGGVSGEVYSGGNFQAVAITSAMDKTRLALQMIGRMLFSQVTEIIHPSTNNGLEANLNASDRENFTAKGLDINMAAYMSELAALAHPVSAHVMSAEMHNQGINSLALLSARRTLEAVDLVAHMCACHIFVSCQAVDMRANHVNFLNILRDKVLKDTTAEGALYGLGLGPVDVGKLAENLFPLVQMTWYHWNTNSWKDRIPYVVDAIIAPVTKFFADEELECSIAQLAAFREHFSQTLSATAAATFYPSNKIAPEAVAIKLGDGTSQIYTWVRTKLKVPTHYGITDDPLYNATHNLPTEEKKSVGGWVSVIYESVRGTLMDMVMDGLDASRVAPRTVEEFEKFSLEMNEARY
ncbi:Phenylalanine ammonia-lyase hkm12 [Cladobotryum mycophilum]|uniref:Phenylalanine ammonia-lyase hkm12 n=1 Tax=Cladobotryum mycophilum TaxID=491253 RepID=A0ABR0S6M2_9HYPO